MLGLVKGMVVNFVVHPVLKRWCLSSITNTVSFNEALKQGKKFKIKDFSTGMDDVISLQYTRLVPPGVAKGAMLAS
ncbi:MAG: hypothetical protein R2769_12805 [Saprospiraceae bacterium]